MTLEEAIRTRRTPPLFEPGPAPEAEMLEALDLARWAPNHRKTEPWRFYLVGPETAERLAQLNADIVREAQGEGAAENKLAFWRAMPGWLVVTAARSDDPVREKEEYAAAVCAVQNAMLYLWSRGIGMKWSTGPATRHPKFYEILGIDRDAEDVVGLFWYGKPGKVGEGRRKPLEEVLRRLA
jgi:nitroreductase